MITIRYVEGPGKKNYIAQEPDGGGHVYTDNRAHALNFMSESHAHRHISEHKWLLDMWNAELIVVEKN